MEMQKPLAGIKVLSFEIQVAGPYCSMMLADQGAAVVKVEQPGSGDTARGGAPRIKNERGEEQSGYFLRFNRNKRSLTLNLKSEAGRQVFRDLARGSDVLIENFRPGLLTEMGLGLRRAVAGQSRPRLREHLRLREHGGLPRAVQQASRPTTSWPRRWAAS